MTTTQLEALLQRSVRWASSSTYYQEYIVGKNTRMRVRVGNGCFCDVMGRTLTVEEIRAGTN